jgi:hypothetical protein
MERLRNPDENDLQYNVLRAAEGAEDVDDVQKFGAKRRGHHGQCGAFFFGQLVPTVGTEFHG